MYGNIITAKHSIHQNDLIQTTADDKAKNRREEAKYSFLKLARWEIPITDHIGPRPPMISISNRNDKQLENNVLLLCR